MSEKARIGGDLIDGFYESRLVPAGIRVEGSTVSGHAGSAILLSDGNPIEVVDSTMIGIQTWA